MAMFSRIFSMCLRLLGPPPGLCPWTSLGDFRPQTSSFVPSPLANSWLCPWFYKYATAHKTDTTVLIMSMTLYYVLLVHCKKTVHTWLLVLGKRIKISTTMLGARGWIVSYCHRRLASALSVICNRHLLTTSFTA